METVNKKIAVEPFPTTETTSEVVAGRVVFKQRNELTRLQVVFHSLDEQLLDVIYSAGDYVFVRGDLCKHQLAKEIFEHEGKKFILIDWAHVVGYDVKATESPDGN